MVKVQGHRGRVRPRRIETYCRTGSSTTLLLREGVWTEDDHGRRLRADQRPKRGFVALIGAPNAGKSTLLNALVGSKVSIVSRKVQTTRALVRGIAIEGASQIIFVDTPGIFKPKRRLDRAMVTSAWGGASDADVVALLLDARKGIDEEAEAILEKLPEREAAQDPDPQQDRPHRALAPPRACRRR